MIRRATRHAIELIAALLAAVTIMIAAAAYLIASGPVPLTIFKPTVAAALADSLDVERVDFAAADVRWRTENRTFVVTITKAALFHGQETPALNIPELAIAIRAGALLRGVIAPTRLTFTGVSARFVRNAQGAVGLGFMTANALPLDGVFDTGPDPDGELEPAQESDAAPAAEMEAFPGLNPLDRLANAGGQSIALRALQTLEILDGHVAFADAATGLSVEAYGAELRFTRAGPGTPDPSAIAMAFKAGLLLGDEVVRVSASGLERPGAAGYDLTLRFDEVNPDSFSALLAELAPLRDVDLPLSGTVRLALTPQTDLEALEVEILGGPGRYRLAPVTALPLVEAEHEVHMLKEVPGQIAVRAASLAAHYDPDARLLTIDRANLRTDKADLTIGGTIGFEVDPTGARALETLKVDLEGRDMRVFVPVYSEREARIDLLKVKGRHDFEQAMTHLEDLRLEAYGGAVALTGRFGSVGGKPEVFMDGVLSRFPAAHLMAVWPRGVAAGARDWIGANISAGRLGEGTLKIEAPAGTFDIGYMPDEAMRLAFTIEDVTTGFVPGLPPMTDLDGSAVLLGDTFMARFDSAKIGRVAVSEGRMLTENLHVRGAYGVFDAVADGPLADVLTLLDQGPFGYPSRYGIDPAQTGGQGGVRLHVELPMRRNLRIEQIEFSAAANIRDFAFSAIPDVPLTDGAVELKINGAGLQGMGDITLAGVGAHVHWREDFTGGSEYPTTLEVKTILDDETRTRLGLGMGDVITGPLKVAVTARGRGQNLKEVSAQADLHGTTLRIPGTNWAKPAEDEVMARLTATVGEDGRIRVDPITVDGPDISVSGNLTLGEDLRLLSLDFPRLRINALFDLSAQAARAEDALRLALRGAYLNADPLLDIIGLTSDGSSPPQAKPGAAGPQSRSVIAMTAQIDRIDLKRAVTLSDATASLQLKNMVLEDVALRSGIGTDAAPRSGTAHVTLSRTEGPYRSLIATATDAGALARGFLDTGAVSGGNVRLTAVLTDGAAGSLAGEAIEGNLSVEEFRVVDAPLLARLLTAGSPAGLGDLLQGDGIRFKRLSLPFESRERKWTFHDGQAHGPSIGITLDGTFDENMLDTDLRGTIVPAYGVNSALGKVPLIGDVFINKDGEGLFAFTYRIVGSEDGSSIYVNPLSALAPGFLRRLFQIGDGD